MRICIEIRIWSYACARSISSVGPWLRALSFAYRIITLTACFVTDVQFEMSADGVQNGRFVGLECRRIDKCMGLQCVSSELPI